jgi:hypothetical protein
MTIDQELRAAADELLEVMSHSPAPPAPAPAPAHPQRGDELTVLDLRQPDDNTAAEPTNRRALVAAGIAAAILLVVGVAIVADTGGGDVVTGPASSPTETDPFPSPSVADPAAQGQSVFRGAGMSSVTVGGPGLVAVGSADGAAAAWTSVDGISWLRVPHDEATFRGEGAPWMSDVTAGGPGLVAVGAVGGVGGSDALVWTSVDGITWSRVPHDEAVFGGGWMSSVTIGGPGLVAVGSVDSDDDPEERTDADAAVWTSVDGITWSRVPHDEAVFGGAENQDMTDVTVGGPGLVAVGSDGQNVWDYSIGQVAAVWTSVDGIAWSRVPHDDAVFGEADNELREGTGQAMLGVAAGGPGLVAVGGETFGPSPFVSAVWTSVDGLTWSRVPHNEEVFGAGTGFWPMVSVAAGGPGLVAVGDAAWTSVDGITWSRVSDDEGGFGTGWGVTAAGLGLVAVGDTGRDAGVWTSADGITWSQVPDDETTAEAD